MRRFPAGIVVLLLCLGSLSAADKEKKAYELIYQDIQILKQQIQKLEEKIDVNQRNIEQLARNLEELLNLTRTSRENQAEILAEQKKLPAQYQALIQRFETLHNELAAISEKLIEIQRSMGPPEDESEQPAPAEAAAASEDIEGGEAVSQEEPVGDTLPPDVSPQEIYNMARSDYLKGNFQLAIEGFSTYRQNFKESPLADNALYWIGESYYSQGKYEEAISQFNELILSYPSGDKLAAAYLKKGYSLAQLGKTEEALSVLRLLISKFPLEEEAKLAEQKIKDISGERT